MRVRIVPVLGVLAAIAANHCAAANDTGEFPRTKAQAEQGNAEAQDRLGILYETGRGTAKDVKEAILWFRKASEQGNPDAERRLGQILIFGTEADVPRSVPEGLAWMKKAAEQGDAESARSLGDLYAVGPAMAAAAKVFNTPDAANAVKRFGIELPHDGAQAVAWYEKAAELGDVRSQLKLVTAYSNGQLVPRNDERAIYWARKAAEQGDSGGQLALGVAYASGQGVPKDKEQALVWLRKAASGDGFVKTMASKYIEDLESEGKPLAPPPVGFQDLLQRAKAGDSEAQVKVAEIYLDDKNSLHNHVEAVNWLQKSAEQGNSLAQYELASMYFMGDGVQKNIGQYVSLLRKSADQGFAQSEFQLYSVYSFGWGVPKDEPQAVGFLQKAADHGLAQAQRQLGTSYQLGQHMPRDYAKAAEWFRRAADQGDVSAEMSLAELYRSGRGVDQDDDEALKWYRRAAAEDKQGFFKSLAEANIARIAKKSTTSQRLSKADEQFLHRQIYRCMNINIGSHSLGDDDVVRIRLFVAPDGNVARSSIEDEGDYSSNSFHNVVAVSAQRAALFSACQPLRPPPGSSNFFSANPEFVLTFDVREMIR